MVEPMADESAVIEESWWQCRFCNESFNASKKLTIHMNSHAEYDNKETKCKDCGNVYGTRKSLWVHRQKKHPRLPNPSPCELCDKTFFDKTELFYHLKTHSNDDVFSHLQAMQEQLEAEQENRQKMEQMGTAEGQEGLSCHICSQRFHDKRVLSKHLRVHEQQKQTENSFSNSALAAMLADTSIGNDENTGEYSYQAYKNKAADTDEFACDMCPKKFSHVNALKVHRGWHFRSSDGRQITDSNNVWKPDMNNHSRNKRSRAANPPVCPYCSSTFASGNNLRRHIVEVHKRNEAKMLRENGISDTFIEKELECHTCGITFSSRPEWVEHKISHARTMKPSTTYEWGCEICGKVFTRKERLLVHMTSHMSGKEEDVVQHPRIEGESNSQSSMSSHSMSHHSRSQQMGEVSMKGVVQKMAQEKGSISLLKQPSLLKSSVQKMSPNQQQSSSRMEHDDDDDDEDDIDDDDDDDMDDDDDEDDEHSPSIVPKREYHIVDDDDDEDDDSNSAMAGKQDHSYPCDLCQVYFTTQKELREHIKSHIESGGAIMTNDSIQYENDSNADDAQYDEDDDDGESNHDAAMESDNDEHGNDHLEHDSDEE